MFRYTRLCHMILLLGWAMSGCSESTDKSSKDDSKGAAAGSEDEDGAAEGEAGDDDRDPSDVGDDVANGVASGPDGGVIFDPEQFLGDLAEALACADEPIEMECGGVSCPSLSDDEKALCIFPCCATDDGGDEVCGRYITNATFTLGCEPPLEPGVPDANCPNVDSVLLGTLPGCCMPEGDVCGVIEPILQQCIVESMLVALPADPPPCDGSGLGAPDDGMDAGVADPPPSAPDPAD